ncbi:copper resistance D family protein [Metabacillus halosaccharovorans]|uniref:copper resistance D family protein n=1 Tax=Metabacillus halosaccharovorans TaxID=930124 RepID=UPI00203EF468|nr:CopD family protein [Metabacillus halosaccharovorans]MCM3441642.1 CopD family protein [Metabacillus halosaccharovorans]
MNQLIPITEYATYMLFSYLVGYIFLQFIPQFSKPVIQVTKQSLLLSVLGIIVLTFLPVVQVITFFSEDGLFSLTAYSILTEFQVGISWLYGSFFAVLLWMTIYVEGPKYLQAFFILVMIISVGYASHASTLDALPGLLSHSIHFLTITIWFGILLHVGWLAKEINNLHAFLRWFTPLSIVLIVILTISGISLMLFVVEPRDYTNSWVLTYGQMLLLKHISIIPILVFGLINGFLSRKTKHDENFNPIKWIQAETFILMIVFFITGVLGTLPPPHQVNATFLQEGPANWIEPILGLNIQAPFNVQLDIGLQSIVLLIIAVLFIMMMIVSFFKKISPMIALSFGIAFIIATYLGLMFSIVIN